MPSTISLADLLPRPLRGPDYGEHLVVSQSRWDRFEVEMLVTERLDVDLRVESTLHHLLRPDFRSDCMFPNLKVLIVTFSKRTIRLVCHLLNSGLENLFLNVHPPYPSMEDVEKYLGDIKEIGSLTSLEVRLLDNPDPSIRAPWAERLFTWIPDKHRIQGIRLFGCTASRDLQELVAACRYLRILGIRAADVPALGSITAIGSLLKNLWTAPENVNILQVTIPHSLHQFNMVVLLRFSRVWRLGIHIEGTQRPKQLEILTQLTKMRVVELRIPHLHTDFDHGMLVALAEAWPDLETLDVAEPKNGSPAETPLPNLHIGSLAVLPIHCPKLKHLRIVVNTSRATSMLPVPSSRYDEHELHLDLTDTLLDPSSAQYSLHFLYWIFPYLHRFVVGSPREVWEAVEGIWENVACIC